MNAEFFGALDLLEQEKGIPKEYMITKIEAALANACRKELGAATATVRVQLDLDKQVFKVFQQRTVVADEDYTDPACEISVSETAENGRKRRVGSVIETELKTKSFRRLSAQAAKQMIIQAIRDAERERQTKEYEEKKEDIITATVDKVDDSTGNLTLNTGTGYAVLLISEQIPGDRHKVGDHIKVFITEVMSGEMKGPLVALSRIHPNFVKRLFELEVPEIQDGTIVIKGVAREPGIRTKISVESRDENVDAVGSCIGKNSLRITSILSELGKEKIDIIRYSDDMPTYISAALSPAKVLSVEMEDEHSCKVLVAPDQLSLAIGKGGRNAKLVAKLTGCKIDIQAQE